MKGAAGDHDRITAGVLERCLDLGFARAGVTAARPSDHAAAFRSWIAAGRHGSMRWLAEHESVRLDPSNLVPGARSIIVVADRYHLGTGDPPAFGGDSMVAGRVARYARGDDYHRVIKRRLHQLADALLESHPGHVFRACVDTAPLLEREHASRAGIGTIGKHTLLLEPGLGSWTLLGAIVTTLDLVETGAEAALGSGAASGAGRGVPEPDACRGCTRCIDACPTGCIEPWSVDASRCVSYLTIEHRDPIDSAMHESIGDWIFGCDACLEACPHGRPTRRSGRETVHEAYAPRNASFDVLEVIGWTEEDRRTAFVRSPMKRAKLGMMRRNALIVAGNAIRAGREDRDPISESRIHSLREAIEGCAAESEEDDLVRRTAQDIIDRLDAGSA